MKIVVLGKGGSGKSTVSSILAKNLAKKGLSVLVVDTDESNYGLHKQLGVGEPMELMEHLGGKKELGKKLREAMTKGKAEAMSEMMGGRWGLSDIPERCLARKDGIALMQIGKVKHFGEGCACPMGALARNFLENLEVKDGEVVIVDTEAGVEHIGRGVERGADLVLMIVDPSYESLRLSAKVEDMLGEVKKSVYYVINKSEEDTVEYLAGKLDPTKVVATFSYEPRINKAGLTGKEVSSRVRGAVKLTNFVIGSMGKCS